MTTRIHDITRVLSPGHPNWPGDTPYHLTQTASIAHGSSVNVMRLETSTHCGTHLDAPYHYQSSGARLGGVPLEVLIGEAQVIAATGFTEVPATVLTPYRHLPERILFYTGQPAAWSIFPEDFTPLTPELIHELADRGVKLVGTDGPSVDSLNSKELPVHRAFGERGLFILEGVRLAGIPEGHYHLTCLPLNMPEADASPVRAILGEL